MKKLKLRPLLLLLALGLILTACGSQPAASTNQTAESRAETSNDAASARPEQTSAPSGGQESTAATTFDESPAAHKEVLVVYFSATGTTKGVAERIAKITDADLYEIVPAEPYSDTDLNWNDRNSRSTR